MKFNVSIETKDRRMTGGINYLGETLRNLNRAGVLESEHLGSLTIVSGGEREDFYDVEVLPNLNYPHEFVRAPRECTRQQNGARAIRYGAMNHRGDWVIKLEDDLDFVDDFLGNVDRWVRDVGAAPVPMFTLAATFERVSDSKYATPDETVLGPGESFPYARECMREGRVMVQAGIGGWYGAQAIMWRREVAERLATWLGPDPFLWDGKEQHRHRGHDLLLQVWGHHVGMKHFGAAVPSFVQHIGRQSNLDQPEINHVQPFFQFPFPGRAWRYEGGAM